MKRLPKDDRERPTGALLAPSEASAGRFFIGVALTDETRHALLRHLDAVEIPGHLDRSEDWHLTPRFLKEYETHLLGLGNIASTVNSNFRVIRTILYAAIREDHLPQEKNPFFRFKLIRGGDVVNGEI